MAKLNLTAFEAMQHAIYALENQNGAAALGLLRDFIGSAGAQAANRRLGMGVTQQPPKAAPVPAGGNPPEPVERRPAPKPPPPPPNET